MPEVAVEGQRRLKRSSVLLVGAGGLGSPAALYLAAAGVGRIGIVDFDVVDESNLQRQILHDTGWVGRPKLESARARLEALNPHVAVEPHAAALTRENALRILAAYDVVVDGTDNFETRYLTNDACYFLKKPNVYGSIYRFEGQASVFWPDRGPCYRCLYPEPPPPGLVPSCAEGGVLGILPGVVGTIQATEAIKILLGVGEPLVGRLLLYDALAMTFEQVTPAAGPGVPALRRASHPHRAFGLRGLLRDGPGRGDEDPRRRPPWKRSPPSSSSKGSTGERAWRSSTSGSPTSGRSARSAARGSCPWARWPAGSASSTPRGPT